MTPERFRWARMKLRRLFRRGRQEAEMDAEMQFHFDQLVTEFRAEGMSEVEAKHAARREFGTTDSYREELRDTWRPPALAEMWRGVTFAVRSLLRTPGFTVLAVLTLGLGIGANTSMFSVVNGVALKPLPYEDPSTLEAVFRQTAQNPQGPMAARDYLEFKAHAADQFAEISGMAHRRMILSDPGEPAEFAEGMRVSANFFRMLGIGPTRGRDFRPEEDALGANRVLVLSDRLWRNRFGARTDIVGREIRVNGAPHTVVGVLPETFNDWRHWGWIDLFTPLALTDEETENRGNPFVEVRARRAPGVEPSTTAALTANFGQRLAQEFPYTHAETALFTKPLTDVVTPTGSKITLSMLLGLSGFVLLIACSNLANFLLARTMARAREFAVRSALGASRTQLLRPLLIEALILALAGGVLALVVASAYTDWMQMRSTGDNGDQVVFTLDHTVLAWAFLCSLVTALAFGLAPALFALRLNLNDTLKSGGRGTSGGRGHQRLRHLLIVGQFALAMVLLTGSTLFINGLSELNQRRTGWESDGLLSGAFLLPESNYTTGADINAFHDLALERLRALPGVEAAALSHHAPFFNWIESRRFLVEGQERPERGREPAALVNSVTPGYFNSVGTTLLAGRGFDARDGADATRTAIINESMAKAVFGETDPIGRRIAAVSDGELQWVEIVGVAVDVRNVLPDATVVPYQFYVPMAQEPRSSNELAIRTASGVSPNSMVTAVRATFSELDPDLPVRNLKSADDRIHRANYQLGVLRDMLTGFAILGLALAAIGIYGVIARTMAQRTNEFGIRLALGAQVGDITRLVLGTGVRLALSGAILGVVGGLGLAQLLAMGFPNMEMNSPLMVGAATVGLVIVALLACYLPARRAAKINPVESLRAE